MEHISEYSWLKYSVTFAEKPWRRCVTIFCRRGIGIELTIYQHKMSLCGRHGFDRYGVYYSGDENLVLLFEMSSNKRVNCRVDIDICSTLINDSDLWKIRSGTSNQQSSLTMIYKKLPALRNEITRKLVQYRFIYECDNVNSLTTSNRFSGSIAISSEISSRNDAWSTKKWYFET